MAQPLAPGAAGAAEADRTKPFQQLEAVMLRQMLQSSGAFRASDSPGAQLRADLFVETLADAVAKAGGLGIGRMLERQLAGAGASAGTGASAASAAGSGAGVGPAASSAKPSLGPPLQPHRPHPSAVPASGASRPLGQVSPAGVAAPGSWDSLEDPNCDAPLPEDPGADSIDDYQPARPSISASLALIRYRERAEAHGADHPSRASGGR